MKEEMTMTTDEAMQYVAEHASDTPAFAKDWDALRALANEVSKLRGELDRERQRLAGCGVAALGYFDGCHPDYDSASLQDTLRLYKEKERLRLELEARTQSPSEGV